MGRFGRDGVELLQALVGGNLWVLESESSRAPELRVGASTRLAPLLPPSARPRWWRPDSAVRLSMLKQQRASRRPCHQRHHRYQHCKYLVASACDLYPPERFHKGLHIPKRRMPPLTSGSPDSLPG